MKQLLPLVLLGLVACTLPRGVGQIPEPTAVPTLIPQPATLQGPAGLPKAKPGTEKILLS